MPLQVTDNRIAIGYGAFDETRPIAALASRQRALLEKNGWRLETQGDDGAKQISRFTRGEETLCVLHLPSPDRSLVLFEIPGADALVGECSTKSPLPTATVAS